MRAVYIDTEFTQLSADRCLISLALVDSSGNEFYVELIDGWSEEACSDFVKAVVLPQLDLARFGLTTAAARAALRQFLEGLGSVEIVGDALQWDWPLIIELLGTPGMPDNVESCREVPDPLSQLPPGSVPHHALLDARLLCSLCEEISTETPPCE
ncbi:hypothetical protein FQZ97_815470 [compost metagenome]